MTLFRFVINSCCTVTAVIWILGCSSSENNHTTDQNRKETNKFMEECTNDDDSLTPTPEHFPPETCPDPDQFTTLFPDEGAMPERLWHMLKIQLLVSVDKHLNTNCQKEPFLPFQEGGYPLVMVTHNIAELIRTYWKVTYSSLVVPRNVWENMIDNFGDGDTRRGDQQITGIAVSEWLRYKKAIEMEIAASGGLERLDVVSMPRDVMLTVIRKRSMCLMKRVMEIVFLNNSAYDAIGGVQYHVSLWESNGLIVEQEFIDSAKHYYQNVLAKRVDLLINQFALADGILPLQGDTVVCAQIDEIMLILMVPADQRPPEQLTYPLLYESLSNLLTASERACNPGIGFTHWWYPNQALLLGREIIARKIPLTDLNDSEFRASIAIATAQWTDETMGPEFMFTQSLTRSQFVGIMTKLRNIFEEYANAITLNYPLNTEANRIVQPQYLDLAEVIRPTHEDNVIVRNAILAFIAQLA